MANFLLGLGFLFPLLSLRLQPLEESFACGCGDDPASLRVAFKVLRVVSGRLIWFFGSFAPSPREKSDFAISRQLRYIM
jgi:hypothetical protein